MPRAGSMCDVELVEDDDEPTAGTVAPPPPRPADPRRRRRVLTACAAVVAVGALVAVAGHVVVERRDRARAAVVATQPRALAPLDAPPSARWELTDDAASVLEARTPAGLLVGVRDALEGPVVVAALDALTGEEVWQLEVLDGSTRPVPDPAADQVFPASGGCHGTTRDPHLVVCLAHDGAAVAQDGAWQEVPPGSARVVVLDSRDGTVVTDLTDALPARTHLGVVRDVVVASTRGGGALDVRAVALDGTPRWSTSLPAPPADEYASHPFIAAHGALLAIGTATDVHLLDGDGRTVRSIRLGDRRAWPVRDAVHLTPGIGSQAQVQVTRARTTVVRPHGELDVDGDVVTIPVDDGSVPGLTLTTDGVERLRAWDGDGRRLWSVEGLHWEALVLEGRVHLSDGSRVETLDPRTGAMLWASDATTQLPVTDGRVLLGVAAVPERGAGTQLVALDPADGRELWRSPLPDGTRFVDTALGLLLAYVDGGDGAQTATVLG